MSTITLASVLAEIHIAVDPIIEEAKKLAGQAVDFLKGLPVLAVQKAVLFIKETTLGTKILNLIEAAHLAEAAGADKFSAVLTAITPAYNAFVDNGGLTGLIETGISVLRQVIQTLYDNFVSTFVTKTA